MQHKQEHKTTIKVKVSDLTQYTICPRLVYFRAKGHKQSGIAKGKERSVIENILLKELAFDLHKVYGGEVDEEGGGERGEGEGEEAEEEDARRLIEEIVDGVERIYSAELKGLRNVRNPIKGVVRRATRNDIAAVIYEGVGVKF
ncbi:MAG: hypothetical protein GH149_02725 [Methanosarcinales archaeon]|nr:hypothetical protein [Methanosarcinales archaeon]